MMTELTNIEMGQIALALFNLAARDSLLPRMTSIVRGDITLKEIAQEMHDDDDEEEMKEIVRTLGITEDKLREFSLCVHQKAYDEIIMEQKA